MRNRYFKRISAVAGAALVSGALLAGAASANPINCSGGIVNFSLADLTSGAANLNKSALVPNECVQTQDKLYGNFDLAALPGNTKLEFSFAFLSGLDHHSLAFNGTFLNNHTYNWGYDVQVVGGVPGTKIIALSSDFTQSSGNSELKKTTTPLGSAVIDIKKHNGNALAGSVFESDFTPGVLELDIRETLIDHGLVSSVINDVTQLVPAPEPATLTLFGAALIGFGAYRRKRRS
jgi:hypothetical protein